MSATVMFGSAIPADSAQAPIVAGFDRLASSNRESTEQLGELLIGELNCLSCHAASAEVQDRVWTKQAPDLSEAGKRLTPQFIRAFLSDPDSIKPGTTMPDILHASEQASKDGAIEFLVHFLMSRGGQPSPSDAGGTATQVELGRKLFHQIGCVACHGPEDENPSDLRRIPLGNLALKTTVPSLTDFLLNPHSTRSSGRMPNLWLAPEEAKALAVYLLREQLDNPLSRSAKQPRTNGLNYEYFELDSIDRIPDFATLQPEAVGAVDRITLDLPTERRNNNYAIRYSGLLTVPTGGAYTFRLVSDDGSRLWIDEKLIVDNDGVHGAQNRTGGTELSAGDHSIEIAYFNAGNEGLLQAFWTGPGIRGRRQNIPSTALWRSGGDPMIPIRHETLVLDPSKIQMGRQMFSALRCVSCHALDDIRPLRPAPDLTSLRLNAPEGCLSENIRKGLPNYDLSSAQRSAITAVLQIRASLREPLTSREAVNRTLATFNCYACHERDGFGGPDQSMATDYFQVLNAIDLGEEGKIPPSLTGVGAKLKTSALAAILGTGELHIRRHYMATRMPGFGLENLHSFIENVRELDSFSEQAPEPPFSAETAQAGRRLVGSKGLSCIACHRMAGQNAAGIQGIDLMTTYDRLTPEWFRRYLLNPASFKPETRMPSFWPDGISLFPDVFDGDTSRQIGAIWSYLSLKKSMPLPEGIVPEGSVAMELIPVDTPIVHRTFMKDVGPRALLASYPEKINLAFDANQVRLAKVWRGRFFDQSGVASGRSDTFLDPLGEDILDLPPGPAFAQLKTETEDWPTGARTSRDLGGQFVGYELNDARRPILKYRLHDILIEETPLPIIQPGGAILARQFRIQPGSDTKQLYFLAASGNTIEKESNGSYRVDGKQEVTLKTPANCQPIVRHQNGRAELLVPLNLANGTVELEQLIRW
ncbi:MAG: PA14 domain-containing protein [Verrucomicrobia bacterium]|nr:PA14 domain-containing protein [Verrucomicrobiota bacterium]